MEDHSQHPRCGLNLWSFERTLAILVSSIPIIGYMCGIFAYICLMFIVLIYNI